MQWVSDLFTFHQVSPWPDEYRPVGRRVGGDQTPTGLINSGTAAMWHTTHLLYDENDGNVGVTAVPRGPYSYAADPLIYGIAVSRGTNNPQAVWRLLHYLSRQPPQDMPPIFTGPVPARQSVATAINYWEQAPADLATALQYTAENNAVPRLVYPAVELLQQAIASHMDDDLAVAIALDQLPAQPTAPTEAEELVVVAPSSPPDWEWIKFLAAQPTAVQVQAMASSAQMMPAHIQAAGSEAYVSLVGVEMDAVFQDFLNFPAVAGAPAMPQSPRWMGPGHAWLRDAYWEAVTGEGSVATALANAEAKFSQYRRCVIDQDAFEDTAAWQACALSVDFSLSRLYAR